MAERWDSNPRWLVTTPLFESGTLNHSDTSPEKGGDPNGIRTRVSAVRGRRPRPLDDGAIWWTEDSNLQPAD